MVSRAKILLVDDHEDTVTSLSKLLSLSGYEVATAAGAESARSAAREQKFDLLVCDLGLKDGDGCDLLRELRLEYGLEGIAVTGYGMAEDIERTKEAGFAHHLVKPVVFDQLNSLIRQTLSRRG